MGADAREQIAQIGKGLDAQALTGCDKAAQHGCGSPAFIASVKKPVVPAHHDGAKTALGAIVVYFVGAFEE